MGLARYMTGFCRDCLTVQETAPRCNSCASPRFLAHAEIDTLSIAHVDCDAFYASVEKRDNPSLKDRPVIIGGSKRGVVSTACYIARINGVHSAMPMFKALKKCPGAVVIKPNMAKYVRVGRQIRDLMRAITPLVEPISIDEAFMDLTGTERLHRMSPARTMSALAKRIEEEAGISVSVGLSHNKFLAKVASDIDKPRGFTLIGRDETLDFLHDKPVSIIWGVGKALRRKLARDGVRNIAALRRIEKNDLLKRYGLIGSRLYHLARGDDHRQVHPRGEAKTISSETTFSHDVSDIAELERRLWILCERVSKRAKAQEIIGSTVVLKLKTANFKILTRNRKLTQGTNFATRLFDAARPLLATEISGGPYRLIGVGISGLASAHDLSAQIELITPADQKQTQAEDALDRVRSKFGEDAITKGRALRPGPIKNS